MDGKSLSAEHSLFIGGYINYSEYINRQWAIVLGDSFRMLDACSLLTGSEVH